MHVQEKKKKKEKGICIYLKCGWEIFRCELVILVVTVVLNNLASSI